MSFKSSLFVFLIFLTIPFASAVAQSEYIEEGESAFGIIGSPGVDSDEMPGIALGVSVKRKVDIVGSYSWEGGKELYGYN